MRITYYLFKNAVKDLQDIWKGGTPEPDYREIALNSTVPFPARAWLQANKISTPPWVQYVLPHCAVKKPPSLFNQSNSFVLALRSAGRLFAITFGHGHVALDRSKLEPDFGLKVTLNTVHENRLRAVQARNIDPTTVSKQLVVNRDSAITVFDVDFYHDLLSKMEGVPDDASVGTRIAGADACNVTCAVPFIELGNKCASLLREYGAIRYRKHFHFVDNVRPVRDDALISELDKQLAGALKARRTEGLGLALPDIGAYDNINSYRVHRGRWKADFPDLHIDPILDAYALAKPGASDQLELDIDAVDGQGAPLHRFSIRDCAVYQVTHGTGTYVLTLGRWYAVDQHYVDDVNRHIAQLKTVSVGKLLPAIHETGKDAEGRYNQRVARLRRFALLDKKCVKLPGVSQIEVCDLFTPSREFIHVKRGTRSATLSHLFSQGSVSARLFVDHLEYRQQFRAGLPRTMRGLIHPKRPEHGRFSVIYAISAPPTSAVPGDLPFFSKVNLLFHAREVQRHFILKVCHIPEA